MAIAPIEFTIPYTLAVLGMGLFMSWFIHTLEKAIDQAEEKYQKEKLEKSKQ